jgi:hypothetical protein
MIDLPPQLYRLPRIGSEGEGHITVATIRGAIPFVPERVFWVTGTPPTQQRGGHAHRTTCQVLVAVAGRVDVHTELRNGVKKDLVLDDPGTALFLPAMCWRTLRFSPGAVLLVMASTPFDHTDYIRDIEQFRALGR